MYQVEINIGNSRWVQLAEFEDPDVLEGWTNHLTGQIPMRVSVHGRCWSAWHGGRCEETDSSGQRCLNTYAHSTTMGHRYKPARDEAMQAILERGRTMTAGDGPLHDEYR